MKTLDVVIKAEKKQSYPIYIGSNLLIKINKIIKAYNYSKIIIITDSYLEKIIVSSIPEILPNKTSVITLPLGERAKTIKSVSEIWRQLFLEKCDRKSLIINIGGGVICDIGGFAASTYMRGIDFINIPTSLLSQVDASVGGKNAINFNGVKNLIGTFNQPVGVIIDVNLLQTLPKRDLISGFAEIIKHGVIADKKYFDLVTSKKPTDFTQEEMIKVINGSCKIKADIVKEDEKEMGKRKVLNFGHTIGHAIEIISHEKDKPLLHGEAISIGMSAEGQIAVMLNLLKKEDFKKIEDALSKIDLPIKIKDIKINDIIEKIKTDKKNEKDDINFTLISKIGNSIINQHVEKEIIKQSLIYIGCI